MDTEEQVLERLRRLSDRDRKRLLRQIDQWIEQDLQVPSDEIEQAVAAVETTWASLSLDSETLGWVAESDELEYDLGRP